MRSTARQEIGGPPTLPLRVNSIRTPSSVAPQRCTSRGQVGDQVEDARRRRACPRRRVWVVGVIGATRRTLGREQRLQPRRRRRPPDRRAKRGDEVGGVAHSGSSASSRCEGVAGVVEHPPVAAEPVAGVGSHHHCVELEGEALRVCRRRRSGPGAPARPARRRGRRRSRRGRGRGGRRTRPRSRAQKQPPE